MLQKKKKKWTGGGCVGSGQSEFSSNLFYFFNFTRPLGTAVYIFFRQNVRSESQSMCSNVLCLKLYKVPLELEGATLPLY